MRVRRCRRFRRFLRCLCLLRWVPGSVVMRWCLLRCVCGKGDLREFVKAFLDSEGFEVTTRDGVDFVGVKRDAAPAERETYVYTPRYRSAVYLLKLFSLCSAVAFRARRTRAFLRWVLLCRRVIRCRARTRCRCRLQRQ